MILTVKPAEQLKGTLNVPASKSYSIRAVIIASCGGKSTIINSSHCDDAKVAMRVAKSFGAQVVLKNKNSWEIDSRGEMKKISKINVGESGTVLRFILPLLSLRGQEVVVEGQGTLRGRPNLFLTKTLRSMGVSIKGRGDQESIPISIDAGNICGGNISIDGSLSSQFISSLLIAAPQLTENTSLQIKGKRIVSSEYILMTLNVLKRAGIDIKCESPRSYKIKGNQKFKGLKNFNVPSDYGLAAFFMSAAALIKSDITLLGYFKDEMIQADGHILSLLSRMGVKYKKTSKSIRMKGPFMLKGGSFSLKNCPDLVPIMAVIALFAKGKTRLYDIGHARAKESDRISDLRTELLKIGANIEEGEKEIIIYPKEFYKNDCTLDPHNDHRLAMAFSILGLKVGLRVKDIECSSKSYPGFVSDLKALGAQFCKIKNK